MISMLDEFDKYNPAEMEELNSKVTEYAENVKKQNIRDWVVEKKKSWATLLLQFLFMLLSFPIFLFGVVNNIIPFKIPKLLTRKMKDPNFHTSVEFGLFTYLFPIFYIIIFALLWIFSHSILFSLAYIIIVPFTGIFAFHYWIWAVKIFAKLRYYLKYNTSEMKNLRNLRSEIISKMDIITQKG